MFYHIHAEMKYFLIILTIGFTNKL